MKGGSKKDSKSNLIQCKSPPSPSKKLMIPGKFCRKANATDTSDDDCSPYSLAWRSVGYRFFKNEVSTTGTLVLHNRLRAGSRKKFFFCRKWGACLKAKPKEFDKSPKWFLPVCSFQRNLSGYLFAIMFDVCCIRCFGVSFYRKLK